MDLTKEQQNLAKPQDPAERQDPVDWEKAFMALAFLTTSGFVTTTKVEKWAQNLHDHVDPRAAQALIAVFNSKRSDWMQGFMG